MTLRNISNYRCRCWTIDLIALTASVSAACATEAVYLNNDVGITRDFSPNIVIADSKRADARIFFKTEGLSQKGLSSEENAKLDAMVRALLESKSLRIVDGQADANYMVQIILDRHPNPSIRNPANAPAQGFVLGVLCRYPIKTVTDDCQNLTYFFFQRLQPEEMLNKALWFWRVAVLPQ